MDDMCLGGGLGVDVMVMVGWEVLVLDGSDGRSLSWWCLAPVIRGKFKCLVTNSTDERIASLAVVCPTTLFQTFAGAQEDTKFEVTMMTRTTVRVMMRLLFGFLKPIYPFSTITVLVGNTP